MRKRTKILIAVVSALVAVLAFAGVAYGANAAAPGDTLYGFDRALEKAGIGNGGLEERIVEAAALMDEGQVDEGLAHAAEALAEEQDDADGDDEELGEQDAAGRQEALLAAAEAVLSHGSERSLEVRTRVAEKLRWMATTELTGKEYGQAVSKLAKGLSLDENKGLTDGDEGTEAVNGNGKVKKEKTNNGKALGHSKSDSESD